MSSLTLWGIFLLGSTGNITASRNLKLPFISSQETRYGSSVTLVVPERAGEMIVWEVIVMTPFEMVITVLILVALKEVIKWIKK